MRILEGTVYQPSSDDTIYGTEEVNKMKERLVVLEITDTKMQKNMRLLDERVNLQSNQGTLSNIVETMCQKVVSKVINSTSLENIATQDMLNKGFHKRLLMPGSNHIVAFTAVLTHHVALGYHQPVEFDKVLTNIGNGYDTSDGHFTTPIRGLYLLSASFLNSQGSVLPLEIVRNGIQLLTIFLDDRNYNFGSQTIVVTLEKGDKIWVRRFRESDGTRSLYGTTNEPYNSFSGVLLYEM